MVGRPLGLRLRHWAARAAALWAPLGEYWPSSVGSIIRPNRFVLVNHGWAHSTRFCSRPFRLRSTDRRPDSSSSSTTPKLYTSLFAVR
ncbi:unnamed protein product [Spirodela intermedia]|uniref:Uncharacterized protein n=1 Tax=Spirodela intermedia TaxID=51605 RepID=A0A7I8KSF8_SPIIN|nr:unnamed protein product [Spirodela intermedia]